MESWSARIEEVSEFIGTDGFDAQLAQVLQFQMNFGNENEENQEKVWESIKSMIRGMPGSPVRRGKKSNLPASVNVVIDQIGSEVAAASEDYFNSLSILQAVLLRHGKSGGGSFTDGGAYAVSVRNKVVSQLKKSYGDSWDGTRDGLLESISVADEEE